MSLDPLRWGLIPYWCKDPTGGRKPINAKAETVATLPSFREAYWKWRCIIPVDAFFEWKAIKGQRAKQPYAIAMKDGSSFGIAGIWENWKDPRSGEWVRTFAIITTKANELVAEIHDRMPAILARSDYVRWLSDEPDPHDLLRPDRQDQRDYTVRSAVWKAAGMKPDSGCLCIGCIEKRLGRVLRPRDFRKGDAFNGPRLPGTPRLLKRRGH